MKYSTNLYDPSYDPTNPAKNQRTENYIVHADDNIILQARRKKKSNGITVNECTERSRANKTIANALVFT